jgi:hypothetical protein
MSFAEDLRELHLSIIEQNKKEEAEKAQLHYSWDKQVRENLATEVKLKAQERNRNLFRHHDWSTTVIPSQRGDARYWPPKYDEKNQIWIF